MEMLMVFQEDSAKLDVSDVPIWKKNKKKSDYVLRTICETTCTEDWWRAQKEDEEIGFLLQKKIEGVKLTW